MNIILINHYAGSVYHGMEFRPYYLAREWVRAGHRVQILAASHSHVRAQQPDMQGKDVLDENIDGIDYRWYRTPKYQGNGLGRVKNMLVFLWAVWRDARCISAMIKADVVISSSTYPMDIWVARRIKGLTGARLVYEVHDLWPLSPMELGGMSKWHPFIMWVQMAEDYAYRCADVVVSMLPKTLQYMSSRGLAEHKWRYVPNGIAEDEWQDASPLPQEARDVVVRLRACGLPIVCYAGTHGLSNALDVLLDAAKLMHREATILMVGSGPERERLQRRITDEGINNVVMISAIPKAAIPALLAEIDITYIGWHPNPLYRFGISPNKLLDYMMSGKPVVHSVHAGNDPVSEADCGITVAPGDPEAIQAAVLKLSRFSKDALAELGGRGRAFVLREQTYSVLAERFLEAVSHA